MKLRECVEKLVCLQLEHPELDELDCLIVDEDGKEFGVADVDYFEGDAETGAASYLIMGKRL